MRFCVLYRKADSSFSISPKIGILPKSRVLTLFSSLTHLILSSNLLKDKAVNVLLQTAQSYNNLIKLDLSNNKLTDNTCQNVKKNHQINQIHPQLTQKSPNPPSPQLTPT